MKKVINRVFSFVSSQWYTVNLGGIGPEAGKLFLQLDSTDPETQVFLERCQERSDAVFTQLFHLVARTLLAPFVSQTSINGWVSLIVSIFSPFRMGQPISRVMNRTVCHRFFFLLFFLLFLCVCVWRETMTLERPWCCDATPHWAGNWPTVPRARSSPHTHTRPQPHTYSLSIRSSAPFQERMRSRDG